MAGTRDSGESRGERLAAALRANLRRRKLQARARADAPEGPDDGRAADGAGAGTAHAGGGEPGAAAAVPAGPPPPAGKDG